MRPGTADGEEEAEGRSVSVRVAQGIGGEEMRVGRRDTQARCYNAAAAAASCCDFSFTSHEVARERARRHRLSFPSVIAHHAGVGISSSAPVSTAVSRISPTSPIFALTSTSCFAATLATT